MVDRYCITTAGIYNTSIGEWVKAADYEAFEAKLARVTAYYEGCKKLADYLDAKLASLVEAAKKFSDRLDFVHEHNDFKAIWFLAHSHYGNYNGPLYEDEFKELKAAIAAVEGGGL